MSYKIRPATRKELDIAVEWAAKEGWNPGLHDADVFWETDPKAFLVLEKDGKVVGTVSGVSYNSAFGFAGFFIIKPEFRNRRLGATLANHMLKTLATRLKKGAAIGIDGVFNMQPTYVKWGFKFSHRNLRMEGVGAKMNYSEKVQRIKSEDFVQISVLDKQCFGFGRDGFLKGWLAMPDSLALKFQSGSEILGFGVIRKCRKGFKIGPLFTDGLATADELFKAFSTHAQGQPIYLDIPEINKDAVKLATNYKLKECFGCARMYLGPAPKLPYERIFGVTTFELG